MRVAWSISISIKGEQTAQQKGKSKMTVDESSEEEGKKSKSGNQ